MLWTVADIKMSSAPEQRGLPAKVLKRLPVAVQHRRGEALNAIELPISVSQALNTVRTVVA